MTVRASAQAMLLSTAAKIRAVEDVLITRPLSPYGVAVGRILGSLAYVGILITNFGHREILFGAGSGWIKPLRDVSPQHPWLVLGDVSSAVFTLIYLGVIAIGIASVLGWHSRITGLLLLVGGVQITELNPLVGDQGDNILRIGFFLVLLTDCGGAWSMDARRKRLRTDRRRRYDSISESSAFRTARTLVHNGAVITLALQLITVYISAAMFKIGGNGWKFGTAISYPLRLDEYRVWPFLNDLVVSSGVGVFLMTYGAVYLQLYFPALLLNKVTRRIALVAVIFLHLGIAVLMGLPWFTLAMVAFDGIFVSTATYLALEGWLVPRLRNVRQSLGRRLARST